MFWGQGQGQSSISMLSIREAMALLGQSAEIGWWDIYLEPRKPLYASW